MTYQTHRRWWTVADAARLLRVHTDTLYDACRNDDFPHERVYEGGPIRIPCEALRMTWVPDAASEALQRRSKALENNAWGDDPDQMQLPLNPPPIPVRVWRNTGRAVGVWSYEKELWGHNQR